MMRIAAYAIAPLSLIAASPAFADTYTKANFSAGILPGNANVKAPFTAEFSQGQTFTGNFVYDNNLVPGAGSGFTNVAFSSFPDSAHIPAGDAFKLNFGSLTFTLPNDSAAQIQYNNGNFNGFVFNTTFTYAASSYTFSLNGGTFQVYSAGDPLMQPLISGYVNIGNAAVTEGEPYVIDVPGAVPEPGTWAMLILGFGIAGGLLRRQRVRARVRFA